MAEGDTGTLVSEGIASGEPTPVQSTQPSIFQAGTTARGKITIISTEKHATAVSPKDLSQAEAIKIFEAGEGIQVGKLTFYGKQEPTPVQEQPSATLSYDTPAGFSAPERMGGETAGAYHARVLREEIAWEKSQPYKQVGPVRTLREYGVVPEEEKIEGYEAYAVKPMSKFQTFYSRSVKAPIARTFFPDVREVREMERLGIDVPFEKKFRAEAQKFLPSLAVGAGAGYVAGAGISLLPSGIQAMKIRTALILGIPAGVGIYKGIKEKEYGMVAGGVIGGVWGYPRGYKFGATKIKPLIQSRFKPVGVEALTETVVRKLPEGDKYVAGTKGKFRAKIGKKTYTGQIEAVTGIEPHPVVNKPKMHVYKGEVYAKVSKWNIAKLKAFAKTTGLSVKQIKARVSSGEIDPSGFIKYTKPVKAEYVGAVAPTKTQYRAETIIKPSESSMRASLEFGRKYYQKGKSRFYRAVGREYKPKFKGPSSDIKIIQKVTFEQAPIVGDYIGPQPFQVQKITTPQVQTTVGPQVLKAVTKTVRSTEYKRIAGQFQPQRRLLPVLTPKSDPLISVAGQEVKLATKQIVGTKAVQKTRRIIGIKPIAIQGVSAKGKVMVGQKSVFAVAQKQKQIVTPTPATDISQKQLQRLALKGPSKITTPTPTPVPLTPYVPPVPFLPVPPLPLGFRGSRKRIIPVRAKYGYVPSYSVLALFKTRGKKPTPPAFGGKSYAGFERRVIPPDWSWSKVFKTKTPKRKVVVVKRRKKKR